RPRLRLDAALDYIFLSQSNVLRAQDGSRSDEVKVRCMKSRRWLWLLILVPIIIGFARLRFDVEVLDLLPPQLAAVQGLKLYQEHFANARELIITIKAQDADQTEAAAHAIAEVLNQHTNLVAGALWQPPWLEHPGESAELLGYL